MSDEALWQQVNSVDGFAEVEPNHKERIILALMKTGNVVGYLGDGINDASALHAADIGISVDSAVDVAKEAADIVLLDKDLRQHPQIRVHGNQCQLWQYVQYGWSIYLPNIPAPLTQTDSLN